MTRYPWTTKRTPGGTVLYCTKHDVAIYGGVCTRCVPTREGWERYPGVVARDEPAITPTSDLRLIDDPYGMEDQ